MIEWFSLCRLGGRWSEIRGVWSHNLRSAHRFPRNPIPAPGSPPKSIHVRHGWDKSFRKNRQKTDGSSGEELWLWGFHPTGHRSRPEEEEQQTPEVQKGHVTPPPVQAQLISWETKCQEDEEQGQEVPEKEVGESAFTLRRKRKGFIFIFSNKTCNNNLLNLPGISPGYVCICTWCKDFL